MIDNVLQRWDEGRLEWADLREVLIDPILPGEYVIPSPDEFSWVPGDPHEALALSWTFPRSLMLLIPHDNVTCIVWLFVEGKIVDKEGLLWWCHRVRNESSFDLDLVWEDFSNPLRCWMRPRLALAKEGDS